MDATALAGALKWKWPGNTQDYYFDGDGVLVVYNWIGPDPVPTNAEIEQAVTDYKASNAYNIPRFDVVVFQTGLQNALPSLSNLNLRWEFAALNTYAINRDFPGMSWYINLLYAGGVATANDIATISAIVAEQGVIL